MSGIDTGIYNNLLRRPKSVAEYDAEAMVGQQNKLALQASRMQMADRERGTQQDNALADVYRQAVGSDGKTNRNMLYSGAAAAGLGAKLPGMQKTYADLDESEMKTRGESLKNDETHIKNVTAKMGQVRDMFTTIQTPEQAAQLTRGMYADPDLGKLFSMKGDTVEAAISRIPTDPAKFAEWHQAASLKADELAKYRTPDANAKLQAKTSTDNNASTNATSRANNASNNAVQMRGQNMTDARSREARADSVSKPFEVTGPDGTPTLVRQDKQGNVTPVEGYSPKRPMQKPVPPGVVKTLTEARDNATTMDRLNADFKPEYGGKGVFGIGADLSMSVKGNTGLDQKSVAFWKDYRKNAELVERHAMFGASLTPGEQASWRSADIAPGMDPAVIKTNLATRAALTKKIAAATADDMVDAGHNEGRVRAIAGRGEGRPPAKSGPAVGTVEGGYRFKGGNAADKANWVKQ